MSRAAAVGEDLEIDNAKSLTKELRPVSPATSGIICGRSHGHAMRYCGCPLYAKHRQIRAGMRRCGAQTSGSGVVLPARNVCSLRSRPEIQAPGRNLKKCAMLPRQYAAIPTLAASPPGKFSITVAVKFDGAGRAMATLAARRVVFS